MASKMKQFAAYTRVTIMAIVILAVGIVVFKNRNYKTNFWPAADGEPVPTLWLMLATAVVSVILFWVLSKMRRVVRDLAEIRAEKAAEEHAAETQRLQQSLVEQERRIDEKLKRAVGSENSQT